MTDGQKLGALLICALLVLWIVHLIDLYGPGGDDE